jgi:O-antigen/teichoic acid export membrane protein
MRRLARGLGASALGPAVTLIFQVASVPIFLHCWGARLYGEWLILSAIPGYLAISDIGFGNVAASDMTMCVAAGKRETALGTFQSTWVLVSTISLVLMALLTAGVWTLPWQGWIGLSMMEHRNSCLAMLFLSAYAFISLQNGVMDSAFRCEGNFAVGAACVSVLRFSEILTSTTAAVCGGGPVLVALAMFSTRLAGSIVIRLLLRKRSPWIRYGTAHASLATIRRLFAPAFAFMAFPIGNAISIQGFTIVIGIVLGPLAVVAFSTMRTLSRIGYQMLAVVARTVWPEISTAFGAGRIELARSLHRRAFQLALVLSSACSVALAIVGPRVYGVWTHHTVRFDPLAFNLLLLVVLANSMWYTSSVVPMATNQHHTIAVAYTVGTMSSLGLAWLLMHRFGLAGAATALLCIDAAMIGVVLRSSLQLLSDTPGEFAASMLALPRLGPILQVLRGDSA